MTRLRDITEADLLQIMNWRMDPEITKFMNTDPKLTLDGQKKWFEKVGKDPDVRFWMILVDEEPAGVINFANLNAENGEIGWAYYVGEKRLRSMKLALALEMSMYDEALINRGKSAVISDVFSLNKGVIALHKLCGCEILKEQKAAVTKNGTEYDVTYMRMTAETWKEIRETKNYEKIEFPEKG